MRELLCVAADHVPPRATAEGLVEHARTLVAAHRRFLFPAAAAARRVLPEGLAALGASVHEVPCYETLPDPTAAARILSALDEGLTLLTVASPSAVAALGAALDALALPRTVVPLAAIGPTTARAASEAGFRVAIVPTDPTGSNLEGLAAAIAAAAARGELPRPRPPASPDGD
jgi:uroporphyrinogen-III synthase